MFLIHLGDDQSTTEKQNQERIKGKTCSEESQLAEVEIVSLLEAPVPKYKLRADYITQHGGYPNQDFLQNNSDGFIIKTPTLSIEQEVALKGSLTPDQAEAALEYFVLCGDRLSQMTQTYNDVDAVTRLLQVMDSYK